MLFQICYTKNGTCYHAGAMAGYTCNNDDDNCLVWNTFMYRSQYALQCRAGICCAVQNFPGCFDDYDCCEEYLICTGTEQDRESGQGICRGNKLCSKQTTIFGVTMV